MDGWPELDELKQVLDVQSFDWDGLPGSGDAETRLSRLLSAAISRVKLDVGGWDEDIDAPDANLSQAALRMAELMALKPELASAVGKDDPTYQRLMFGHHRTFGIA
jgi:hypothetical protein